MLKNLARLIAICVALSVTPIAHAVDWTDDSHNAYMGDWNSDGLQDIYLKPKPNITIVPYDVLIPIVTGSDFYGLILQQNANGTYTVIHDPADPNSVTWTLGGHDIKAGDFDGDGLTDYLLQPEELGGNALIVTRTENGQPGVLTELPPAVADVLTPDSFNMDLSVAAGVTLIVSDTNSDGRADITIARTGFANVVLTGNTDGTVSAPSGGITLVGTLPSSFDVSSTGAAQYSIPISAPAGTGGMRPNLALTYSSAGGAMLAGHGWALSGLSTITRCPQTIAQNGQVHGVDFSSDDRYCLDGQQLIAISGAYSAAGTEYRTEINNFSKIISAGQQAGEPEKFEVTAPNGMRLYYGYTDDSRIESTGGTSSVRFWALSYVLDRFDNRMDIVYDEDSGTDSGFMPDRIEYTRNDSQSLTAKYEVDFVYENRPASDVRTSNLGGSQFTVSKRLKTISVTYDGASVHDYQLTYEATEFAERQRPQPAGQRQAVPRGDLSTGDYRRVAERPIRLERGRPGQHRYRRLQPRAGWRLQQRWAGGPVRFGQREMACVGGIRWHFPRFLQYRADRPQPRLHPRNRLQRGRLFGLGCPPYRRQMACVSVHRHRVHGRYHSGVGNRRDRSELLRRRYGWRRSRGPAVRRRQFHLSTPEYSRRFQRYGGPCLPECRRRGRHLARHHSSQLLRVCTSNNRLQR